MLSLFVSVLLSPRITVLLQKQTESEGCQNGPPRALNTS